MTLLLLGLWLAVWKIVAMGWLGQSWWGISCRTWAAGFSPLEAIFQAARPYVPGAAAHRALGGLPAIDLFLVVAVLISLVLNAVAVAMVRFWNPSRETQPARPDDDTGTPESIWGAGPASGYADAEQAARTATKDSSASTAGAGNRLNELARSEEEKGVRSNLPERPEGCFAQIGPGPFFPGITQGYSAIPAARTRRVWDNPVIWREIRTWAYGRKVLVIKLTYLALFGLAGFGLYWMVRTDQLAAQAGGAVALVPLFLLSLVLVNAQAVTSMTSERDGRALDLLLVTDLTPKEIVFGKLGGVFYNTKEMVVLPMLLCVYLCASGALSLENLFYLLGGLAVLYIFVAMLGVHCGMIYANSQGAIATSLGTVFFLFVGVATCMWILVALGGSFQAQLIPFFVLIVIGSVGLYVSLGVRNPSAAIGLASFLCPLATFYAITSFLLHYTLGVFLVTTAAYGFATAAMLVPALCEFDVATGRTTAEGQ
jgi:hypothetical protein